MERSEAERAALPDACLTSSSRPHAAQLHAAQLLHVCSPAWRRCCQQTWSPPHLLIERGVCGLVVAGKKLGTERELLGPLWVQQHLR